MKGKTLNSLLNTAMAGAGGSGAAEFNIRHYGCINCGRWVEEDEECWVFWQEQDDIYYQRVIEGKEVWERWCERCFWGKVYLDELWLECHEPQELNVCAQKIKEAVEILREHRRFNKDRVSVNRHKYRDPRRGTKDA